MCNGTLMDKLIVFAVPLMISGVLQLMFNAVDIIVVGQYSGSQSLAAVGSTTALIAIFTNLFIGISLGANVLAARFGGSGPGDVGDGSYIHFGGAAQRCGHGICGRGNGPVGAGSDGDA